MLKIALASKKDRQTLFADTAQKLHIADAIIEKDFWVCFLLDILFNNQKFKGRFIFKGGTSLSKCYHLISRFSEDIDLIFDQSLIGLTNERLTQKRSNNQQSEFIKDINVMVASYLRETFVLDLAGELNRLNLKDFVVEVDQSDKSGASILFYYPSIFKVSYIKPAVKLEIGIFGASIPTEEKTVKAYIYMDDELADDSSTFSVSVIDVKRTLFEKLTILHSEAQRESNYHDRYSRHYYDTFILANSYVYNEALTNMPLLIDVVEYNKQFYYSKLANYNVIY